MAKKQLLSQTSLIRLAEWQTFLNAAKNTKIQSKKLRIIEAAGLKLDLSAQFFSDELAQATESLLEKRQFHTLKHELIQGKTLNTTENRAAWHSMLREPRPLAEVSAEHNRVLEFVGRADNNRQWRNIVHIGIGGSDWGVRLTADAFGYAGMWRNIRYVSNIDGHAIEGGLAGLDPHETLIVIATKSFGTSETLENAKRAYEWIKAAGIQNPYNQMIAITANPQAAQAWGIDPFHIFKFWDWVGGRFSLWSAIGVTTGLTVGSSVLAGLVSGAHAMDRHFTEAPIANNAPVQLAMAGIVNRNVKGYDSHNLAVYDSRLANLVPYLQQLEMESLGKTVDHAGNPIEVATGPVVWGMPGTDGQHTFFQWLHQGSDGAPVDFIICQQEDHRWAEHHKQLWAHCLAQREALLTGKSLAQAQKENEQQGMLAEQASFLAKHRQLEGGRPSNLIVLPRLTPFALGALLALYEHKVFVQALVWGLNPFDQWGVELGKVLAKDIAAELEGKAKEASTHDESTQYWIETLIKNRPVT